MFRYLCWRFGRFNKPVPFESFWHHKNGANIFKMTKYPKSQSISKEGVNFVRSIIEKEGSIFHEVHDENDVGIDAFVEFVIDEQPANKMIAIQIKAGNSYYSEKKNQCVIPVGRHFDYWANHNLSVYGIVYVPSLIEAYYVNVKSYFDDEYNKLGVIKNNIRISVDEVNQFNREGFYRTLTWEGGDKEVLKGWYYYDHVKTGILQYIGDDCKKIYRLLRIHSELQIFGYALDEPMDNEQGKIDLFDCMLNSDQVLSYTRNSIPTSYWDESWKKQYFKWHLRFDDKQGIVAIARHSQSPV